MELITMRGGRLYEGDRPFRFVLVNAFYLQDEAAYGNLRAVEETLDKCVLMGVRVVRTWAFNDGERPNAIQPRAGVLGERGLVALDRVLAAARARGLRLLLPLADYWPSYGGVAQYLAWHGRDPAEKHWFFTDEKIRAAYAGHVARLLERVSTVDGLRYGEHPAVLAWELMNEPRGDGLDPAGDALVSWVGFAAAAVRAHARQLVAVGEEGRDEPGSSFARSSALVDLATCHLYPEAWGWKSGRELDDGAKFIADRARVAAACGRPLVVEELGLLNHADQGRVPRPLAERRRTYAAWLAAAYAEGVAGIGPWLFAYDDRPDGWDRFTFYRHVPPAPIDRYADLLEAAARRFAAPLV